MKTKSKDYYKKKADRLLQELGRKTYSKCEVCGNDVSCLHHYIPKSRALHLRYFWPNLVPLCVGCHFKHHTCGDPDIHNTINKKRGIAWLNKLNKARAADHKQCDNMAFYKEIVENLTKVL